MGDSITYRDFLHSDSGLEFWEYLGTNKPEVETKGSMGEKTQYRYVRKNYGYFSFQKRIEGEWKFTKKEAKESYKAKLKESKIKTR